MSWQGHDYWYPVGSPEKGEASNLFKVKCGFKININADY
jgi:hypothetical protein